MGVTSGAVNVGIHFNAAISGNVKHKFTVSVFSTLDILHDERGMQPFTGDSSVENGGPHATPDCIADDAFIIWPR